MPDRAVDLEHPANAAVLRRRLRNANGAAPDLAPEEVADHAGLGTHPDLLEHFWYGITDGIPDAARCRRIVYGRPALVSPASGVVFGIAGGTHYYALRLPPAEREAALAVGGTRVVHYRGHPEINVPPSTDDLAELGEEWVFCAGIPDERRWCRAARAFADAAPR